jgi:glycosyltransferase involved in cell wall biosynthesis
MSQPRASIVVPALNEAAFINIFLNRIDESVKIPVEIVIVVDDAKDNTISAVEGTARTVHPVRCVVSNLERGPANAIRYGFHSVNTDVVVITMADGSDDPRVIDDLILLIERGCAVACASRYMPGGQQIGGPRFKKFLSKNASRILRLVAGIGTHDATNSFKAYSTNFVKSVGIASSQGFEVGLELTAKAHRSRRIIAELPTIWIDRSVGNSNFQLHKWLPHYLQWFFYSFGRKINDSN